jgi:hypothetical protein
VSPHRREEREPAALEEISQVKKQFSRGLWLSVLRGSTRTSGGMRFHAAYCLAIASCALLAACDFTAGVSRTYRLDDVPLPACVERTLRQVEGVTNVTYAPAEVNRRALHRFSYQAQGVAVRVDIEQKSIRPEYEHSYVLFNTVPSQELIARLRPIMARVDQALENSCRLRGLSRGVQEHCPRGPFRSGRCGP